MKQLKYLKLDLGIYISFDAECVELLKHLNLKEFKLRSLGMDEEILIALIELYIPRLCIELVSLS